MSEHKDSMLMDVVVTMCGVVAAYLLGEMVGRMIEQRRIVRSLASEAEAYLSKQEK